MLIQIYHRERFLLQSYVVVVVMVAHFSVCVSVTFLWDTFNDAAFLFHCNKREELAHHAYKKHINSH